MDPASPLLVAAVFVVALVYASVGHAGATGYIAVMALAGISAGTIRPTALLLNVVVASIATAQFFRAGHFLGRLYWPLAVASVPCAAIGGAMRLSTAAFEGVLGVVLAASALWIVVEESIRGAAVDRGSPPRAEAAWSLLCGLGGAIGLLSGLTGVGGGVFLTPALLLLRAANVKSIAAVTAPFILVNSLAGLAGGAAAGRGMPPVDAALLAAAACGGWAGSQMGAFRLPARAIRLVMAAVLVVASWKLLAALVAGR